MGSEKEESFLFHKLNSETLSEIEQKSITQIREDSTTCPLFIII
jgi:hypothetical protein